MLKWMTVVALSAALPAQVFEAGTLVEWKAERVIPLAAPLHHVQGIDVEQDRLWVSSVDAKSGKGYLSLLDTRTGKLLRQVEVQHGKRIHPGGLQLDGDSVWLPVAEYDRDGPTTMQRRNKRTLALERSFEVSDHIGCVAAGPNILMGGNWDSKSIYSWAKDGRQLAKSPNPGRISFQDLKWDNGSLIGSGNAARDAGEAGAVEWWSPTDWRLVRRFTVGKTDRGVPYANEGMAWRGGKLYLLPEDSPSRLFVMAGPR